MKFSLDVSNRAGLDKLFISLQRTVRVKDSEEKKDEEIGAQCIVGVLNPAWKSHGLVVLHLSETGSG